MRRPGATASAAAVALALAASTGCSRTGPDHDAAPPATPGAVPRWVDVTSEKGIDVVTWCGSPSKDHLLESVGTGVAFADLDGDGHDDILVANAWRLADRPAALAPAPVGSSAAPAAARRVLLKGSFAYYRNRGDGSFVDDTARAGLGGGGAWATGIVAGDIDGDGDLDVYVTCFGPNLLYRNRGDGTFEEVAGSAGVADAGWGGGAAFFDADGDGDLDLYVSNYIDATMEQVLTAERTLSWKGQVSVMTGPFGLPGGVDHFYRNRGDGTFEEASEESGLVDRARSYGLGVLAADLDGDGDIDVYVANDSNPNYLFRNDGGGHFTEMGVVSGAAFDLGGAAQASMGVAVLDYDRDGALDLFTTNFADDASTLYRGEGRLFFADVAAATGIASITYKPLSWGTVPVDFDQDGLTDLVIANGHIYPQVEALGDGTTYRERLLLVRNTGTRFEDASARAGPGFAVEGSFRGLAVGDLDGDGDPDLVLTRIDQTPLLLRCQGGDPSRRIVVEPEARPWPRWIGARIEVTAGGKTQSQVILSGGSYASQSALRASFALGGATEAERVVVRFPYGGVQEFRGVRGGSVVRVAVPRPPPR